jgi:hypothetical protein
VKKDKASSFVRLSRWLGPTLLGPAVGAWLFVLGHALVTGASFASAMGELVLASMLAVALGFVLLLADFALLATRLRRPPTGSRGWLSSMLAGGVGVLLWRVLRPSLLSTPASHLVAVGVAALASALLVRLLFSRRARGWIRFA